MCVSMCVWIWIYQKFIHKIFSTPQKQKSIKYQFCQHQNNKIKASMASKIKQLKKFCAPIFERIVFFPPLKNSMFLFVVWCISKGICNAFAFASPKMSVAYICHNSRLSFEILGIYSSTTCIYMQVYILMVYKIGKSVNVLLAPTHTYAHACKRV